MKTGILSTIGNTPLVRLEKVLNQSRIELWAKLEAFNPSGSVKDRTAYAIINGAIERGEVKKNTVIIESSSGNLGVGLAQVCAYLGLKFICVVDAKTTAKNVEILRAYGARVEIVLDPDPVTGEFLQARINRVKSLSASIPNSYWTDQYSNLDNPRAHQGTMEEILTQMPGPVDYLFCAASTCGTLRGCADFIRQRGLKTKLIAVDAVGSVIFGQRPRKRLIPGHGASIHPKLFYPGIADDCVHVTDLECVIGCHRLLNKEAMLTGGSSGGILMALERYIHEIPGRANCVGIFCDRGERYLDTIYNPEWVELHFGRSIGGIIREKGQAEMKEIAIHAGK